MPAQPDAVGQLRAGDVERPLLLRRGDRDPKVLFRDRVLGEDRRRIRNLDTQMGRRRRRRDLLPLGEVAAESIQVAIAPYCSVGEIGERPAADERMERGARGVEDPNKVLVRLAEPLSGERQPASGQGGKGKHRVCPEGDEHGLGIGDQALGGLVIALLRACDRLGKSCGDHIPKRADLLGDR
jgi:hypothetical protein